MEKCNEAKLEILESCKLSNIKCDLETYLLDLSSLQSVKDFANVILSKYQKLDSLILNAGVMFGDFSLTKDGIENQFGTNHIGHFYLTKLLLPLMVASQPSTIVSVSSMAHWWPVPYPTGIYPSLEKLNDPALYEPTNYYGQSKLANILFAKELSRQLQEAGHKQLLVNVVHPGGVRGNLMRHATKGNKVLETLFEWVQKVIYYDEESALTVLYPAVGVRIFKEKITGQYFVPIARLPNNAESSLAQNSTFAREFWIWSNNVVAEKVKNLK